MPRTVRSPFSDVVALAFGFVVASLSTTVFAAVRVDPLASIIPSVWLLAPSDSQGVSGTVTLAASASPDTTALQFQLNGSNLGPAITSGACSMSWNTGTVGDGAYTLTVIGIDDTSNSSVSAPVTITVENTAPQISNVAATGITSTSATITWTTNQPTSSGVDYGQSSYTNSTPFDVTMTTQHAETMVGLAPGTLYQFRVSSWNGVGMLGTSGNYMLTTGVGGGGGTSSPAPPAPVVPGGCTTPDPFANMGGGTCMSGGWYPPGTAQLQNTAPPAPAPAPPAPTGCLTPDPFVAIGGGTCSNGGWMPRGVATPPAPQAPQAPPVQVPAPTPVATGCSTSDPFVALGGGTCFNGGWFPPGMLPAPGNVSPVVPPAVPAGGSGGCVTPDPFSTIPGLHGVCVGGGWYPVRANP